MDEETYRRKGVAALIPIKGDIEGRVILDLSLRKSPCKIASHLAGARFQEGEQLVRETVCELANMVIGNSVTLLNDQGFRFKVFPPEIHVNEAGSGRQRRYRSHGHWHRDALRRSVPEHRHALPASPPPRTRRRRRRSTSIRDLNAAITIKV